VNFTVGTNNSGGGGGTGSIFAAPSAINFVYQTGVGMQASQQQQVFLAGGGNYTSFVTMPNGGNWLSTSCNGGSLPQQYCYVYANASNLAANTYTGSITFTNTTSNQTSVVSVQLLVTGATAIYTIPGDLIFNYIGGTTSVSQFQDFTVLATNNASIQITSAAVTNPSSTPWMTISQNGSNITGASAVYAVTVNATGLANGTYTGSVTITASSGSATNSPITVPVVLNVTGSSSGGGGGNGSLTLSTSALTFNVAQNSNPTSQQLTVSANSTTSFTASATAQNCGNWLSISPAGSLTTNQTITVTANPTGLSTQTCTGTITLVSNGTQTVGVTMNVGSSGGSGGTLNIGINGNPATSSPALTFTANAIGAAVSPQYLTVTSPAGSASVSFTASLSGSSCGWVNLGIIQNQLYQTPLNPLNVGATTGTLATGTYNCTLSLTPVGGTAQTVPLTLTINGNPTITVPTTTLTFSYAAGSAAPNTQTVTITAAGSSASSFTATATTTSGGTWLSVAPASGTATSSAPATLTVSVNPANLAAGTYNGSISVAAGTGTTGSGTIPVTLTVTAPSPNISTVLNAASFLGSSVSPGELVSVFGTSIGPLTPLGPSIGSDGNITTKQGNVQVFFGNIAAPLTYVSSGQINASVPYAISGQSSVQVTVVYLGQTSNAVTLNVVNSAPGIFSATGTGTGQGAILNQNNTLNTSGNPEKKGNIIQIFATGEGITSPPGVSGSITNNSTTVPVLPVAVTIGGQPATVVFRGEAPGLIAGVLQVNVMIPSTVSSGANAVVLTVGSNSSQQNLTLSVQ
jgi:uncharacterized protein (TIGR03437 family)